MLIPHVQTLYLIPLLPDWINDTNRIRQLDTGFRHYARSLATNCFPIVKRQGSWKPQPRCKQGRAVIFLFFSVSLSWGLRSSTVVKHRGGASSKKERELQS